MCRPGHKGRADLTSSPPSSHLTVAVPTESPASPDGNCQQGLRSLWHLSRHLTARADDNHAAPRYRLRRAPPSLKASCTVRARVRFLAYHRIKPHVPPLVRAPVNSFEFQPFDPRTFVHQRQSLPREMPSQSVFCVISMHFTATPHIPPTATVLQQRSINGTARVEPVNFTADLRHRLRTL